MPTKVIPPILYTRKFDWILWEKSKLSAIHTGLGEDWDKHSKRKEFFKLDTHPTLDQDERTSSCWRQDEEGIKEIITEGHDLRASFTYSPTCFYRDYVAKHPPMHHSLETGYDSDGNESQPRWNLGNLSCKSYRFHFTLPS